MKNNIIKDKTFPFALKIIELYKILKKNHEYEIGSQILRSGTSIGANVEEATAGQTRKDFIAKLSISSKEARETRYWLLLIKESKLIEFDHQQYLLEIDEIIRILTSIVKTLQTS